MALKPLNKPEDTFDPGKELPWLNVFAKSNKDSEVEYDIRSILQFDSGLMVCTRLFKSYVHEGTNAHKYLLEALDVFVDMYSPTGVMVGKIYVRKRLDLFIDDERLNHYWHKTENKYVQVLVTDDCDRDEDTGNPFLAGMGVLPVHTHVGEQGVEGEPETRRETLEKGKKKGKLG